MTSLSSLQRSCAPGAVPGVALCRAVGLEPGMVLCRHGSLALGMLLYLEASQWHLCEHEALRSVGLHWRLPLCYRHLGRFGLKEPLLGCAGQAGLVGWLQERVRKVSGMFLHPQSHIFPIPESPLAFPLLLPDTPSLPSPPFSCSSVTPLSRTSCQHQSCISGSFKMFWWPLISELWKLQ